MEFSLSSCGAGLANDVHMTLRLMQRAWAMMASSVRAALVLMVLHASAAIPARAQTPPDSIRRQPPADSANEARERMRQDSIRAARAADTIKAPIAQFESPTDFEATERWHWDREEILRSGAMYLTDLLDRVPGVTSMRTAWLAGIHTAAFRGDFQRIRVFVDGLEVENIEPRDGGALDHVMLPLWTLDAIEVEVSPGEVRVWCRTTTVRRTTPYTRVDIFTGDLNTNAFRGVFARRYANGINLQVGGQQLSTQRGQITALTGAAPPSSAGDGDQQAYNARLGWARGRFSIDAYGLAVSHRRDRTAAEEPNVPLPPFQGTRREGYVRVGYGDTLRGLWSQLLVSSARARLDGVRSTAPEDSAERSDSIRTRAQSLLAVGWRAPWLDVSLTARARGIEGKYKLTPALRAAFHARPFSAGVYAEQNGIDSTQRAEAFGRAQPFTWLAFSAAHSVRSSHDSTFLPTENSTRAEAAVQLFGRWFSGGILRHGESAMRSPTLIGTEFERLSVPASLGVVARASGSIVGDLTFNVNFVRWDRAAYYRPQTHLRTEIRLASNWLRRFPSGQFGIDAKITHELRDPVPFYYGSGESGAMTRFTPRTQLLHGGLEIRIQQASLFYQYRNLTGITYEQVPGILMPPAVQVYGVRWEFWN